MATNTDLSAAGNPLPSDHVPDGKSPADQAIYQRYLSLIGDNVRQEALSNWVEDCRELRAAGEPRQDELADERLHLEQQEGAGEDGQGKGQHRGAWGSRDGQG